MKVRPIFTMGDIADARHRIIAAPPLPRAGNDHVMIMKRVIAAIIDGLDVFLCVCPNRPAQVRCMFCMSH